MYSIHLLLSFQVWSWKALSPSEVGGSPLGKIIFIHLLVLVSIAFSISFLAPAALISVRAAFPHVRVFFSGSWSSVEFLFFFHENMVLPLGWSHSICGVYSLVSSALCAFLPCSARESTASLRGSPLWAFDEEGICTCCDPFLKDLYDFSDYIPVWCCG